MEDKADGEDDCAKFLTLIKESLLREDEEKIYLNARTLTLYPDEHHFSTFGLFRAADDNRSITFCATRWRSGGEFFSPVKKMSKSDGDIATNSSKVEQA
jgi:hypothetical protein